MWLQVEWNDAIFASRGGCRWEMCSSKPTNMTAPINIMKDKAPAEGEAKRMRSQTVKSQKLWNISSLPHLLCALWQSRTPDYNQFIWSSVLHHMPHYTINWRIAGVRPVTHPEAPLSFILLIFPSVLYLLSFQIGDLIHSVMRVWTYTA